MPFNATTYLPLDSLAHRADARVKIILVFAYSITLFLVETWTGLGLCLLLFAACAILSRLPIMRVMHQLLPFGIILAFTLAANAFTFDVAQAATNGGAVSAGVFAQYAAIPLVGSFGFSPAGCARGCFYVLRIALLMFASVLLTSSTTSTQLTRALESFMRPLARMGVKTHDTATIVSIALRFIPVTIDEFQMVRAAQTARGAQFDVGKLGERLRSWETVLIPMFVGLYRRADDLACAMDARCYGYTEATRLDPRAFSARSARIVIGGCALCAVLGWAF
jgi:energy-coupling factor transport system permease protein